MWGTRLVVVTLSVSLLLSWMPFVHAGEDKMDIHQQGEFDLFLTESNISFSPSHMVNLNDNVEIQAEVTRAGDQWSIDWIKEGVNIPLGGGGDDDVHMVSPRVIKDNGTYKMWYGGATGLGRVYEIFYATSPDGFTWTKFGVVLTIGPPGDLDDQKVCLQYVVKEGDVYKMWYSGADDYISSGGTYRIFYATSNDGTTWNKQGLVLDVDPPGGTDARMLRSPVVLNESGVYKMWYTGTDASNTDRVHYATSPDGVSWTKHGVVLDRGSPGDYDETGAGWPFVWRTPCGYTMLYTGRQLSEFRVLEAVSSDGIEWLKRGLVVDLGPDPEEDTRIDDVFVLFNGSIPERMWYAALGTNYQIFSASPTLTNLTTSASVTFYLDAVSPPDLMEEHLALQFPVCGCRVASTNWTATLLGVHEIIVVVDRQDLASESNESNNIASRRIVVMNPLIEADAGPDQIVNEGDLVELNASASHGAEEVQYWSDSFEDGSKIADLHNTTIQTGSIVLARLSFERTHLFDVDPGFVLLDDQPLTDIWWDQGSEVVRWHSDRDDPTDTWERFVGRLPIELTDRYDIRADMYYLYTRADPVSEVYPLLLKDHGTYRSTSHFDPANNSLVYLLYGGNPDRHSLLFWDGLYNRHEPMSQIYDSQFNKLLHANISYDSITRVLYVELRDDVGALVSSGSVTIPPGSFRLTEFGVGAIGTGGGGISEGYTDTLSLRAYGYPDGNVTSVLIEPQNMVSWGALNFNTTEPIGTSVTVEVLDEFGNPIASGLRAGDSPIILTDLVDPVLYPRIRLKAMLSTDRNETPSLLDWSVSYVAGKALASHYWDVNHLVDSDGDGNFTNDVDLDGQVVYNTYGDNGMYEVHLNVSTDTNETYYDMCNVTVINVLPSVIVTPPPSPVEGVPLTFDITASDPGSDDLTLVLDWGDGSNGSWIFYNDGMGPDPPNSPDVNPMTVVGQWNHTYGHAGVYSVNATVIDDDGGTTTLILPLDVSNVKPTSAIDVSQPNPVAEGSSVLLGGYFDDPSWLDNHTVTWDFGDGQSAAGSFTPGVGFTHHIVDNVTHVYGDDGLFQVTLNVTDDLGGSDDAAVAITVLNLNPSANINCPSKVSVGIGFQCFTNATDPGSDDLTVDWDWDDGTTHDTTVYFNNGVSPDPDPSPGPVYPFSADDLVAHSYASVGNYTIVLNVTDDDGGYVELQFAIEVVGPPETTIVIGNPQYVSTDVFITSSTPISFIVWDRSGTGIESTYYRVDGGSWVAYLSPFTIVAEGPHTIYFNSTDMLGGAEATKNFSLIVDDTPPSSAITVGTPNYTDVDLWIGPSTPLTITSIDTSCGLSHIEYELDGGGWQTYTAPITVPAEGSHVLLYRGIDNLGNTEIPQSLTFWVDGSPPVSSIIVGTPNYTSVNLWISP
ncbi:MAG: PKD domain-containing protein, partial [Thermoplasmata archaeon]